MVISASKSIDEISSIEQSSRRIIQTFLHFVLLIDGSDNIHVVTFQSIEHF